MSDLYGNGQTTYTIQDDNKTTTVIVDRQHFALTEPARQDFEAVHDQWELTVCEKYPHDPLIGSAAIIFDCNFFGLQYCKMNQKLLVTK